MSFLSTDGLRRRRRAAERAVALIRKWLVAALGLVLTVAAHAATQDITSQFAITRSGLVLNRATNTFDSTITLKNTSGAPVACADLCCRQRTPRLCDARQQDRPDCRREAVCQSDAAGHVTANRSNAVLRAQVRQPAAGDVRQRSADPLYDPDAAAECSEPDQRGRDRWDERVSSGARRRLDEPVDHSAAILGRQLRVRDTRGGRVRRTRRNDDGRLGLFRRVRCGCQSGRLRGGASDLPVRRVRCLRASSARATTIPGPRRSLSLVRRWSRRTSSMRRARRVGTDSTSRRARASG